MSLIAKSHMKTNGPKTSTEIHGPLGRTFHLLEKTSATADWHFATSWNDAKVIALPKQC
jgi:hypothetical protein